MLTDISDLRPTIIPKSDQINADDLIADFDQALAAI